MTRDYPPAVGGISTHASNLARELGSLGVDVEVLVGGGDLKTLVFPVLKSLEGFDIVHSQSSPYGALVGKSRLVVTVHAPVKAEWGHYAWTSKAKSLPAVVMERATFRKARAILAVSETTALDLKSKYGIEGERITVIGNGVDYQRFLGASGGPKRPSVILLVSRLEPRKNLAEAIRALGSLPKGSYEARIAGDGSQRRDLEELASSLGVNAKFLGKVPGENLLSLYRDSGIFLTTSYSEGFGLSLLEGMSAGCAVVASDIPTHRDLIQNGQNGILYRDSSDLVSKLTWLLSNPSEEERLGEAATKTARDYSWEDVARKVLQVYDRCLSSQR